MLSISNQGVVAFHAAPDFENPSDADTNNIYKITVTVSDGYLSANANFEITVTNDTSDDETYSAWDGNLVKDDTYNPYDKLKCIWFSDSWFTRCNRLIYD